MTDIPLDWRKESYRFDLPTDLIAQTPVFPRDASRLLVVDRVTKRIAHHQFSDLPQLLPNSPMTFVANNTRVIRARRLGHRLLNGKPGGKVEFFWLSEEARDPRHTYGMIRSSAKIDLGFEFECDGNRAVVTAVAPGSPPVYEVLWGTPPDLRSSGLVPLPPYIHDSHDPKEQDRIEREYNTSFAKEAGSVAAPTAGRHFTPELLDEIRAKHHWEEVTLHVGVGTFQPMKADVVTEHTMHAEWATISKDSAARIQSAKEAGEQILAVGTTSVRTLEGFYDDTHGVVERTGEIDLFIYPGAHAFKVVDAMITNFHLPESTLLMLVAAFLGDRSFLFEIYREAIAKRYRFFSYGDAMLIL
jgi:S-adenosylmethionine:tRNA ribosyltransferase-isomerase